jgi:ABC-2 type transport system permease protein
MGRLIHAEFYKLFHDKIYWTFCAVLVLFNMILFSGSSILSLTGQRALEECMKKEIATVLIVCIYGGVFIGDDLANRTLYHGLTAGKSHSSVLLAKAIVYAVAADGLLFLFPLFLAVTCTIRNGWGNLVPTVTAWNPAGAAAAFLILGFAVSALSLLAAVCFRDVGRTIGIPILLFFLMILLLNSPNAPAFSRILPLGILVLLAEGSVTPTYGVLLGVLWLVPLEAISTLVFCRAELR